MQTPERCLQKVIVGERYTATLRRRRVTIPLLVRSQSPLLQPALLQPALPKPVQQAIATDWLTVLAICALIFQCSICGWPFSKMPARGPKI
jgi:hypothetical protein